MKTNSVNHLDYLHLLEHWVSNSRQYLTTAPWDNSIKFYAEGTSCHWPMQTNCNVFAAYSVLANDPDMDEKVVGMSREELADDALALLGFILKGHKSGSGMCGDGDKIGLSWISPLGYERMMHGVEAIWERLTPEMINNLRNMLVMESDWHTDELPLVAGLHINNKPESNIWSACLLRRTVDMFPDVARKNEYLERAADLFVNGISIPSDAECEEIIRGKKVSERNVGANYCETYSLDHHGYLNVGYMVICLSNLAMYYFSCKKRGIEPPAEVFRHVKELWALVKKCTFRDGRLMRIGGDTRARYSYCQDYCIPSWLMMLDKFGDTDVPELESGWLKQVKKEMDYNADGSFMSKRLETFKEKSLYYYTRLEGDKASTLSMGAYWRRIYNEFEHVERGENVPTFTGSWHGEHHGSNLVRDDIRSVSFCWEGAQGATAIFQPAERSDLTEWQRNLTGEVLGTGGTQAREINFHSEKSFPGGFLTSGSIFGVNKHPLGEGEPGEYRVADYRNIFAALPDGKTAMCLQSATMTRNLFTAKVSGISWKIPNDIFNNFKRNYIWENGETEAIGGPKSVGKILNLESKWIKVEDCMSLHLAYGGDLQLYSPAEREITTCTRIISMSSLYCDEICCGLETESKLHLLGDKVYDLGYVLRLGADAEEYQKETPPQQIRNNGNCRGIIAHGADGRNYLLIGNFGGESQDIEIEIENCKSLHGISESVEIPVYNGKAAMTVAPESGMLFTLIPA